MSSAPSKPFALICGDDDFAVKQRARQIHHDWCDAMGGMDHETIEASVANGGEAISVIGRLREALNTLPFFGGGKVVWLRDCNFLGDDRTASSILVSEAMGSLAADLKDFQWQNVRLLVSAGKVDKRKSFYKAVEKTGFVEVFTAWSVDDRDWAARAESAVLQHFKQRGKTVAHDALADLVSRVGPQPRQLESEAEKLCLFSGERKTVTLADVLAVSSRNKTARAFALGDALGDRSLPRLLKRLDEELWETKFEQDKSGIGLLYGLISKVRAMIFLKEMMREGWIRKTHDYNSFKSQLDQVPADKMPQDKKLNPLALNPYVLFKALPQAGNYTTDELVNAMEILLRANQRLVSSGLDEALVLQQALVQIVSPQFPA